ncbi:uncharacterized protein LOC131257836 [Magnolia sinica]|uniref:uncharacterized protein LOC131257836 n=1 Tax=Magnolia sinica TaxID=86752 RepID=UPI002659161E|nr:uncharacterized protein LOC131257836 [Magnolia sinica]
MERENRKRGREEEEEEGRRDFKENTKKLEFLGGLEDSEIFKFSDSFGPLGVFEFPWAKEEILVSESDEWKSHDVFHSSLIDGCSVEFPIEGPGQIPAPVVLPAEEPEVGSWPSEEEEIDGADCIWSCVLSQPLSIEASKLSNV